MRAGSSARGRQARIPLRTHLRRRGWAGLGCGDGIVTRTSGVMGCITPGGTVRPQLTAASPSALPRGAAPGASLRGSEFAREPVLVRDVQLVRAGPGGDAPAAWSGLLAGADEVALRSCVRLTCRAAGRTLHPSRPSSETGRARAAWPQRRRVRADTPAGAPRAPREDELWARGRGLLSPAFLLKGPLLPLDLAECYWVKGQGSQGAGCSNHFPAWPSA